MKALDDDADHWEEKTGEDLGAAFQKSGAGGAADAAEEFAKAAIDVLPYVPYILAGAVILWGIGEVALIVRTL